MDFSKRFFNLFGNEKGFLNIATGNLFSNIVMGIFWLALATIMTPEEYGHLNYLISVAIFASMLSVLGLHTTIKTYLPKGEEDLHKQSSFLVLIADAVIVLPLFLISSNLYVVILFLTISFFRMHIAEVLGRRVHKKFFILNISRAILIIPLSIALFYVMGVNGIILGYALPTFFLSLGFFKPFKEIKLQFSNVKKKIRFVVNSYIIDLTGQGPKHLDKLMIAPLFGFELLGVYQIGFQFLILLSFLPVSIVQFLQPQEAAGLSGKNTVKLGVILSFSFAAIAYFVIPFAINTLFPNFEEGIQAAQITVLGLIPMTFISILNSKFLGRENSKQVLWGFVVRFAIFLVLLIVLGNILGLIGLSLAIVISYSIQTIILVLMYHNLYGLKLGNRKG